MIIDVDEVLGLFMHGFERFLIPRGLEMRIDRFALFQNIFRPGADEHIDLDEGRVLFNEFFATACETMEPTPGAREALAALAKEADVVILTNAPDAAREARGRWLVTHGFDYPLVINQGPKGPATRALAAKTRSTSVFVDDLLMNLESVATDAPHVRRFQHVADTRLRPFAPTAHDRHPRIDDWRDLGDAIRDIIRV